MQEIIFKTKGVCATRIRLSVANGVLVRVCFEGGCDGNSQGLCRLLEGMAVEDVIKRLRGICCDGKDTSCPDQLALAIEKFNNAKE
jgi:uncharacterized protein (TIGR03905 family)